VVRGIVLASVVFESKILKGKGRGGLPGRCEGKNRKTVVRIASVGWKKQGGHLPVKFRSLGKRRKVKEERRKREDHEREEREDVVETITARVEARVA